MAFYGRSVVSVVLLGVLAWAGAGITQAEPSAAPEISAEDTGVAEDVVGGSNERLPADVEHILTAEPDPASYTDTVDCIAAQRIRAFDVLDHRHVVVEMSGQEMYLIQFERRCPGLRRHATVLYEPRSNHRFCRLDSIRPVDNTGLSRVNPGMRCTVPGFQSISEEQLVLIKHALNVERGKSTAHSQRTR